MPLAGTVFGALSACAGLSQWPLIATEIVGSTGITLVFRAMTVDAASCGAAVGSRQAPSGFLPAAIAGSLWRKLPVRARS